MTIETREYEVVEVARKSESAPIIEGREHVGDREVGDRFILVRRLKKDGFFNSVLRWDACLMEVHEIEGTRRGIMVIPGFGFTRKGALRNLARWISEEL